MRRNSLPKLLRPLNRHPYGRRVQPNYFDVISDGEIVGRIYRMLGGEVIWRWMMAGPPEPTDGPSGGVSISLEQAKAAIRAEWEAQGGNVRSPRERTGTARGEYFC